MQARVSLAVQRPGGSAAHLCQGSPAARELNWCREESESVSLIINIFFGCLEEIADEGASHLLVRS